MVVVVDLDDEPLANGGHVLGKPVHHTLATAVATQDVLDRTSDETVQQRGNPNINGFSAALSCYPIVRQLARQLDLNTLHDLSRACRQFRANLLEYRDQLVKHTLRCEYEQPDGGTRMAQRMREARGLGPSSRTLTSGRLASARCARDMVAECQRCATVVCRNCTIKPPPTPTLRARHRRLCRTCTKAPLPLLTAPAKRRSSSAGSLDPQHSSPPILFDEQVPEAFTAPAFQRNPCICDDKVWLCQPCGQQLRNADIMYVRAWTWRTRYSHYLGGVGTGAGEGNEGVVCGMGASCLGAKVVEHEDNYDADSPAPQVLSESPKRWTGSSYHAQEIEGIGGWLKMKTKKQVSVGECVKIYEDERDRSIQFLEREVSGKLRSWCSWCERVVLSASDRADAAGKRPPSSGTNSASST